MFILLLLSIFSVIFYIYAPNDYSFNYILVCFGIFLASSFILLRNNCKQTLVKFEFFFLLSYFFIYYVYGLIYYPVNPYFSFFQYSFNEHYITKGAALATVGACFFNLAIYSKIPNKKSIYQEKKRILKRPTYLMIALILIFLPYMFRLIQSGEYNTEFEQSYINVVLVYIIYYFLFASFMNIKSKNIKGLCNQIKEIGIFPLCFIFMYALAFILIGSRTIPMRIMLLVFIMYNVCIRKISNKIIVLYILIGIVLFAYIGVNRSGILMESWWDVAQELTINNRSQYILMEYSDQYGINYGQTMLLNILSAIPFLQTIFSNIAGLTGRDMSSAQLVTYLHYDGVKTVDKIIGFGTNIIGDIYISFGFVGVIVFMYTLGYILKESYHRLTASHIVGTLIYVLFFIDCIYITRSGYFTCVRSIIWTLFTYYLSNKIVIRTKKQ